MGVLEDRISRLERRQDELDDHGERLARVETRLEYLPKIDARLDDICRKMDEHNKVDRKNGNVVIPVAVVVGAIELVRQILTYLQG